MIDSINNIIKSMPKDLSDIEKVRYIYINLGKLFSYDLRVLNKNFKRQNITYDKDGKINYINKYLSCDEVSLVLALALHKAGINSKVVDRINPQRKSSDVHMATSFELNGKEYLLDLTLDLYLIQAGMKTTEFCSKSALDKSYETIDDKHLMGIDKKIGYLSEEYSDSVFDQIDKKQSVLQRINMAKKLLSGNFVGEFEKHRVIQKCMKEILAPDERGIMFSYNLFNMTENNYEILSVFNIASIDDYWYVYDDKSGFRESNVSEIKKYLDNDYKCNNPRIYNDIYGYSKK